MRRNQFGDGAIDDGDGEIGCEEHGTGTEREQRPERLTCVGLDPDRHRGDEQREARDRSDISRRSRADDHARQALPNIGMEGDLLLEARPSVAYQVIPGIALALDGDRIGRRSGLACRDTELDRRPGDIDLRSFGAAGEFLDGMAIAVTAGEVHRAEEASLAQHGVCRRNNFDELRKVHGRVQAHAGDDVADGDRHRRLALVFLADDLFSRGVVAGEALVDPDQRRRHRGIVLAQPLHQLDHESRSERTPFHASQRRRQPLAAVPVRPNQIIGYFVGDRAQLAQLHDGVGKPAEILHQHDPQRNGHRPELADRERLHLLIGQDKAAQHLEVEVTIGVRGQIPRPGRRSRG